MALSLFDWKVKVNIDLSPPPPKRQIFKCAALTSSFQGDLAGLPGSHYDNTLNPRQGGKVGIWSQVTTQYGEG